MNDTDTTATAPGTAGLAYDYLNLDSLFSAEELALRDRVREFVARRIRPNIAAWYEAAYFPREIVREMGALGLLGMHLKGYGCPGRSAVEYGLAAMELEAGDSGLRTFVSVQGSLAMTAISKFGSEEHKQRWLPGMAAGELVGCFGLTEPAAGSDPASMLTTAARDGDEWVIDGVKRWIGLASIADVAVIWAKTTEGIRGFAVPTAVPGFTATPIEGKLGMRASRQCDITLTRRATARGRGAARRNRVEGTVLVSERGPLRDHVGRHGCGPRLLRGRTGLRPAAAPVRQADRGVPAHPGQAGRHDAGNPEGRAGRAAHRAAQGRRHAAPRADLLRQAQQRP